DDTASYKTNSDNTPEQIESISENISNSDIYQETNIQYSEPPICTESRPSEDKKIDESLNRVHKETVSKEIRERNREKKIQVQNLSSNNNSPALRECLSESCDIKNIPNTSLPVEDLDDSDEIELTKNQNIEQDLL
ncbi:5834_t:CDS:1, partial [Acaulospora morrowiae]